MTIPASDLNLTGTTHTNAGTYTDKWTFSDPNYVSQSGIVTDTINKSNATIGVTPYNVTYTGTAHSATGMATGVSGINLASDLTINSAHTNAGTYTDSWLFNAGLNYNTASGTVIDTIVPAPLVISANNETMVQGNPVPTLTVSYKGFVDGQTAANLTVKPIASASNQPS